MRIKVYHKILIIIIIFILLVGVYLLLDNPRIFSIKKEYDINSGDVKVQIYVCFLRIKNEIETTRFSQEVRRLNISVSDNRIWKTVYTKVLPYKCIYYPSGGIVKKCNFLIELFDVAKLSDQERLLVLERVLISMKKKGLVEAQLDVDRESHALLDLADSNLTQ